MVPVGIAQVGCMVTLAVGAAVGVAIGILFAPQSGKETRRMIGDKVSDVKDKASDMIDRGRDKIAQMRSGHRTDVSE